MLQNFIDELDYIPLKEMPSDILMRRIMEATIIVMYQMIILREK